MVIALELVERLLMVGAYHVGDVLRSVQVADLGGRVLYQHIVSYRVDQVRLAQADAAIDKQRIVGSTGVLGHLQPRGARQLVGLADNEIVERKFGKGEPIYVLF